MNVDIMEFDVFISHASEDKDEVALPLANILRNNNVRVWIDSYNLKLGDRLRYSIDEGLKKSRYGIVILSSNFINKSWPLKELDALISLESSRGKVILPILHNINQDELSSFSPLIADKLTTNTNKGLHVVASEIISAIRATSNNIDFSSKNEKKITVIESKNKYNNKPIRNFFKSLLYSSAILIALLLKSFDLSLSLFMFALILIFFIVKNIFNNDYIEISIDGLVYRTSFDKLTYSEYRKNVTSIWRAPTEKELLEIIEVNNNKDVYLKKLEGYNKDIYEIFLAKLESNRWFWSSSDKFIHSSHLEQMLTFSNDNSYHINTIINLADGQKKDIIVQNNDGENEGFMGYSMYVSESNV